MHIEGVQGTGNAGKEARNDEDEYLLRHDIDAH
jgi:hypothetical protein